LTEKIVRQSSDLCSQFIGEIAENLLKYV